MDPRPYHFEYRRPRPYNPTYQSSHLYDSMAASGIGYASHLHAPHTRNRSFSNVDPSMYTYGKVRKRANSSDMAPTKIVELDSIKPQRFPSRSTMDAKNKLSVSEAGQSKMAGIGNSLMRGVTMEQGQVFKKQEKQFNIISFHPKAIKPNLRHFPKLTAEDKLLQKP